MDCVSHAVTAQAPKPFNSRFDVVPTVFPLCRYSSVLLSRPIVSPSLSSSPIHPHRSFLGFAPPPTSTRSGLCRATSPGSPLPEPDSTSGLDTTFSKLQDRVQIFFAVLFWMSLFFWACAWDGRNGGRPTKGPRFRR